jgi:hypothetical protein
MQEVMGTMKNSSKETEYWNNGAKFNAEKLISSLTQC